VTWPRVRGAVTVAVLAVMVWGVIRGVAADDLAVILLALMGLPVIAILWGIDDA
jgi:hypothetical protein